MKNITDINMNIIEDEGKPMNHPINTSVQTDLLVYAKAEREGTEILGDLVGIVDRVDGFYIKLKRNNSPDSRHHWIPLEWVMKTDDKAIYLNKNVSEFKRGLIYGPIDLAEATEIKAV
jgi:hypothetical protein